MSTIKIMTDIQKQLLEAYNKGSFFEVIAQLVLEEQKIDDCVGGLISLHNQLQIDVVNTYKQLKNKTDQGFNYFSVREIFAKVLPKIDAPIKNVMKCVSYLIKEAGNDLLATSILPSFIDFCSVNVKRPIEALKIAEDSTEPWVDFIPSIIVAGTKINMEQFFNEAIRLTKGDNIKLRNAGCFTLGCIQYTPDSKFPSIALEHLEKSLADETDGFILGNIIRSTCYVCAIDNFLIDKGKMIVTAALTQGDQDTLYVATEIFGLQQQKKTPKPIINVIMFFLINIEINKEGGIIKMLDYGISYLLQQNDLTECINFLESFLIAHPKNCSIKLLQSSIHLVYENKHLLSKLLTKWFIIGERCLCCAIEDILSVIGTEEPLLEIDLTELKSKEAKYLIFLAHKTIGYLFNKPITCANIIILLMRQTQDAGVMGHFSDLLFEPLLINFTGQLHDFLTDRLLKESELTREAIQRSLNLTNAYWEKIRSVGVISELHPSLNQREMYARFSNQEFVKQHKEIMKTSFIQYVHKIKMLHGSKAVVYIPKHHGELERKEISTRKYGTSIEMPKQDYIDPFGPGYIINLFKAERMINE